MVPKRISLAALIGLMNVAPVFAHHPDHHGAPSVPTPRSVFTPPPVVAAPPPAAPAPAPTTHTASFTMPTLMAPSVVLPTDSISIRANVRKAAPAAQPVAPVTADKRFEFSDQVWQRFDESSEVHVAANSEAEFPSKGLEVGVAFNDQRNFKFDGRPMFMPTANTSFEKTGDSTVNLKTGAMVIRAGSEPVFVQGKLGDKESQIEIHGKALALVSVFDGKLVVVNLTDSCCASVTVTLPEGSKFPHISVESGQVLELYNDPQQPDTNLVATKVLVNERLSTNSCLLLTQAHYVRLLKRFQLTQALPKQEMDRVLKTAAAVSHLRP